jgi:hypothetical protein
MSKPRSARSEFPGAAGAGLLVVFFCLLLLWHDPLLFWNDDYELSILPVFADVARSWNEGHLPLLSPYSWVCSNLAGEFQYGTFSIFINAVVVLIWKFPLAFAQQAAALSIAHLFMLAAGAFLLARGRGFSNPIATVVAMVASLNGWIVCWGATDWFGALGAFAWLPWAWWGLERALDRDGTRWRFLWPAPFVYLVVTGGFPYTVVMLGVIAIWLAARSLFETRSLNPLWPMIFGIALGFGLSAPAWLALLDYVQGSGRVVTSARAHQQWVVPLAALPGFVLPCWTVNWADFSTRYVPHTGAEMASGLVAPAAFVAGLLAGGRGFVRRIRSDLFLLVGLLIVSMLPSAGVFRWSFRWLPLIHLVLVLCAAEGLRAAEKKPRALSPGIIGLLLVGVTAVFMLLFNLGGPYTFPLTWMLLGFAGLWAALDFWRINFRWRAWGPVAITFVAFLATYLCIRPNCGVPKYNLAQELTQPAPLDPARLYLSVYPAAEYTYRSESRPGPVGQVVRPGSTSMWAGERLVNGYSPILAGGVAREFDFAIHGEINASIGDYLVRDQAGPAGVLEQLGVDGLVVASELKVDPPASQWDLVFANAEGRVFHRHGPAYPPVRPVTWIDTQPEREFAAAEVTGIDDSRNSVHCDVTVPPNQAALLSFARPFFRGYKACLDGRALAVGSYRGLMPLVEVPAGTHGRLVLSYRPPWLIYGGAVSILCMLIIGVSWVMMARARTSKDAL